ncbi:MAG: GFA family protein [Alphaproteobacteria bacterium]|nr:GFA family protein [Alphaproteobacteria bacterium]MBV9694928.1 GFA family protein [Alphaproteobacteria bacterium]
MSHELSGRCACGAVRYRLTREPIFVHCCHCLDCQRQTGSAFVLNALIESSHVETLCGNPVAVPMPTDSGRPHDVYRCTECQTAMWSDYGRRKLLFFVRVGTLETPSALKPNVHIFTRSKQPWVGLPPDVPQFEVYYDMQALWPAQSLERRRQILGAG